MKSNRHVTSVPKLLEQCILATLAAQRHIHRCLRLPKKGEDSTSPKPSDVVEVVAATASAEPGRDVGEPASSSSLGVRVKGVMAHKDTRTTDYVTEADLTVQDVIMAVLSSPEYTSTFLEEPSRAQARSPTAVGVPPPFAVIGEEEEVDGASFSLHKYKEDLAAVQHSPVFRKIEHALRTALVRASGGDGAQQKYPWQWSNSENTNVQVFIDPIDGTNAFVEGDRLVPMTLVGVSVNGCPVAGVVNRVFSGTSNGTEFLEADVFPECLSFCLYGGVCVLWGQVIPTGPFESTSAPVSSEKTDLPISVVCSGNISSLVRYLGALQPAEVNEARGAGNKCMLVVAGRAAEILSDSSSASVETENGISRLVKGDVFLATSGVKKWDCCAPHAFIRCLGGELRVFVKSVSHSGRGSTFDEIRYNQLTGGGTGTEKAQPFMGFDVSTGRVMIVAKSRKVMEICEERIGRLPLEEENERRQRRASRGAPRKRGSGGMKSKL